MKAPWYWNVLQAEAESTPSSGGAETGSAAPSTPSPSEGGGDAGGGAQGGGRGEGGGPVADGSDAGVTAGRESASVEGDDWSDLSRGPDDAPIPAAKPAEVKPPVAAEQPKQVAETPPVAKPADTALETPEAKTARELAEQTAFAAEEKKLFDGLVAYYKLPDDMAERLATEPELVLPHMAAQVHTAIAKGVQRMLAEHLPGMIRAHLQVDQTEQKAKDAFYGQWPKLVGHENAVLQAAHMFNQLNPKATPEQRIRAIGRIVSESLGIENAGVAGGNGAAGAPQVPAAKPPVFRPAGGGQPSPGGAPPRSSNEFELIAEQLLSEG